METELGLEGTYDLTLLRVEGGLVELGDEAALRVAPQVTAILGAPRVLGILAGELLEVAPVVELLLDLLGLFLLVRGEEYVPDAALLGKGKPGVLVLLVEVLDLLLRRALTAHGILPDLLKEQACPDLLPKLILRVSELPQSLLEGLFRTQVLPCRCSLLSDLLLSLVDLFLNLFPRYFDVVLPGIGFPQVKSQK